MLGFSPFLGGSVKETLENNRACVISQKDNRYRKLSPICKFKTKGFSYFLSLIAYHLLFNMLDPNPKTRISIEECFEHAFFKPEKREMIETDFATNIEESSILTEIQLKHLYFYDF